jgi:glycosyltransferase involved in cell wall biosynthesis
MIPNDAKSSADRYQANAAICTLVVATLGRSDLLLECLQSVPADERPHVRVIVVDQNDTPFLSADLARLAQEMDLQHIRVPFRNASRARNHGAALASTPWVSFPDDDCRFLHDTLAIARQQITQSNLDLLSGQVVDDAGRPHIIGWLPHETELLPGGYERCFAESTFFIRKQVFDSVQGFDPIFGPGTQFPSNEGGDLLCRLWRTGTPLRSLYTPLLRYYHPDKDTGHSPQINARIESFAFGEGAFTLRHYTVLPMKKISVRLARVLGGLLLGRENPRRRMVYLRGFLRGALTYLRQTRRAVRVQSHRNTHAI